MFIFNLTYIKPILEVEKMLPAHISPELFTELPDGAQVLNCYVSP